jgi:hypothetical protein
MCSSSSLSPVCSLNSERYVIEKTNELFNILFIQSNFL